MQLVYEDTQKPVRIGDTVRLRDGEFWQVHYFPTPHKSSSQGKVTLVTLTRAPLGVQEFFVSVIGAKWIDREDQTIEDRLVSKANSADNAQGSADLGKMSLGEFQAALRSDKPEI